MSLPVKVLVSALIAAATTTAEETIKETPPLYAGIEKCRGGDLNPYALRRQILSLVRLPISPPRPHFL